MDYYRKYLKYKQKYSDLKAQLNGGGFEDVWKGLEEKITNEHMLELNNTVKQYKPDFSPHPLTNTIDGIKAAFAIMSSTDFQKFKGIKNRQIQPSWYKENPEIITIHSNPKYFEEFNKILAEIKSEDIKDIKEIKEIKKGGNYINKIGGTKKHITLNGRRWDLIKKIITTPISVILDIAKFGIGLGLFIPAGFLLEHGVYKDFRDAMFDFTSTASNFKEIKNIIQDIKEYK